MDPEQPRGGLPESRPRAGSPPMLARSVASRAVAATTSAASRTPSRSRRVIAETHSTSVVHHTTTCGSWSSMARTAADVGSLITTGHDRRGYPSTSQAGPPFLEECIDDAGASASGWVRGCGAAPRAPCQSRASGCPPAPGEPADRRRPRARSSGSMTATGIPRSVTTIDSPPLTRSMIADRPFLTSEMLAVSMWLLWPDREGRSSLLSRPGLDASKRQPAQASPRRASVSGVGLPVVASQPASR